MKPHGRWAVLITGLLVAVGLFLFFPSHPAYADPHAVFYTAIGQQQLFFNVLAALDQASFVETPAQRKALEVARAAAPGGQRAEDVKVVTETRTDLSGVLTRNITLEGNDLWTAFQARQFGLENMARNNVNATNVVLCQLGLGRTGCSTSQGNAQDIIANQKKAFNVDPVGYEKGALGGVTSILGSGTTADQQDRQEAITGDSNRKNPLPFDSYLAQLYKNTKNNPDAALAVARLVGMAANVFLPDVVDPNIFSDITFSNGKPILALQPPSNRPGSTAYAATETGADFIDQYTATLSGALSLPSQFIAIADRGNQTVQTFLNAKEQQGAMSDTELYPKVQSGQQSTGSNSPANATIGTVEGRITVPAHAKIGAVNAFESTIGTEAANPISAPADAATLVGKQPLVERSATAGAISNGQVEGANTLSNTDNSQTGRVLHAFSVDPNLTLEETDETKLLGPDTNPIPVYQEHGNAIALEAIGYKPNRGGCGCSATGSCSCSPSTAANKYGQLIMKKINQSTP